MQRIHKTLCKGKPPRPLQGFKSQLAKWKQSYLIISPIDGRVSFNKVWFENQSVSAGDLIVTIIPKNEMRIIGKADIPSTGVGKVKPGQTVNIKLDNYPYMEFGMLKAKVKNSPLFFLLGLVDTLDPIKSFLYEYNSENKNGYSVTEILEKLNISFTENSFTIENAHDSKLDFSIMNKKADSLVNWLDVKLNRELNRLTVTIL